MKRIELFGCPMDVATMDETVDLIRQRVADRVWTQHVVVNVAKIVNMQRDPKLAQSVKACDLINIDGQGVVLGARLMGHAVEERVAGIDLFSRLLHMASEEQWPVFLLGAEQEVLTQAVGDIRLRHPGLEIAGSHHGYFWSDEPAVVNQIRESGARLLFVAITSPKKENFIARWSSELGVDFVMGVGGTFDVMAGAVKRAPLWMQRHGLEWLYRVIQEPGRMWKRYLTTNAAWALMLARARLLGR